MDYSITKRQPAEVIPYPLLLAADESQDLIDTYLLSSQMYLLRIDEQVRGVYLLRIDDQVGEIMNIAVEPAWQGKGLGKALLSHAKLMAQEQNVPRLVIKTGNSSVGQLALYQQQGFDLIGVNYNYFLTAYTKPIWENGIQCKHQLILELLW